MSSLTELETEMLEALKAMSDAFIDGSGPKMLAVIKARKAVARAEAKAKQPQCKCNPAETGASEHPCEKPNYRFDHHNGAEYCHTCDHDRACHSSAVEG